VPSLAPSQLASDLEPHLVPKEMEVTDIRRVVGGWADAAVRARDRGFDIVYVYGAHSYLPMQFLSSFYNKRTDGYGGGLEAQARFWLETLEAVRAAVGTDCAVATRIAVEALGPAGIHVEEALEFVGLADGLVDLWDVNVGSIAQWSKDSGTSRYFDEGYQLEWTGSIRQATEADRRGGAAHQPGPDGLDRPQRRLGPRRRGSAVDRRPVPADEDPRGADRGDPRVHRFERLHHEGGRVRPPRLHPERDRGRGARRSWHPERFEASPKADRGVLVVGAGPAGMECAVVLGRRGFDAVHLIEAEPEVGGRMRWIRRLPTLGDWGRIVDHRKVMLSKLRNVEVVTGRRLSGDDVRDYGAQLVIVATGSRWSGDGLQSATHEPIDGASGDLPQVLTPEQVMEGARPPGRRVVVYDAEGYFVGPGIAELLAHEGFDVQLVTSLEIVSAISDLTLEGPMLRQRLHGLGVGMHRGVTILVVEADRVSGEDEFEEPWTWETDGVVLVTQQVSDDALYRGLVDDPSGLEAAGIEALYRIGDCVAPRMISEAIFDGHRLAREIDGPDPSVAMPFDRERSLPDVAALPAR
jgi:dimethylamine/trimethylamine dehydrogenase